MRKEQFYVGSKNDNNYSNNDDANTDGTEDEYSHVQDVLSQDKLTVTLQGTRVVISFALKNREIEVQSTNSRCSASEIRRRLMPLNF